MAKVDPGDCIVVLDKDQLAQLFNSEASDVAKSLMRTVKKIERMAKEICPVDTGRLRSSILGGLRKESRGLVGVVGTNVEYAAYVELGTRRMQARPYLVPAMYEVLVYGYG